MRTGSRAALHILFGIVPLLLALVSIPESSSRMAFPIDAIAAAPSACGPTISFGETLLCALSASGEIASVTFAASSNDRVLVRMGRRSSGLNPHIQLLAPGGAPLCEAFSAATAIDLAPCLLPSDGTYTILASNYNSTATGSYALSLQRLNNPANAAPLSFGQTTLATLAIAGELDTYTFAGSAADSVLVRMGSTAAALTPHLRLFQADGSLLCAAASYADALDIPACLLPSSGQYTIVVSDYSGVDTGSYGITLQRLNNPGNAGTIAFGHTTLATISAPAEIATATFVAAAADRVVVRVGSATSGFTPHIRLYGPDGVKLCEAATYNSAISIGDCLLPSDGRYTLLLNDYNGANAGSYGLALQRVNAPSLAQPLTFGQRHAADLVVPGELDTYRFAANSGDTVLLRMGAVTSAINPQLSLYGPEGTLLCGAYGYPAATELPGCILPTDGAYTLLVNAFNNAATGGYGLTVQRLNNPSSATTILFGQHQFGAISAPGAFDTYTFSATAQSPVRVRMRSATGFSALYPHMRLYSPGGALLCQASGYPGTVEIDRCVVPADATYTLIATNYNGAGQGDYMLSLLCLAGDCGPAMPMATNYVPVVGR